MIGYSSGHYRRHRPQVLVPAGETVLRYMREGCLRFVIGGRFPMSEAADAHRLVESRQSTGKLLLIP